MTRTAEKYPQPFVKWAGGKRQLLEEITTRMPVTYGNFYEPFVGGGALFFNLQPEHAVINDINSALVNCYQQIKRSPADVISNLELFDDNQGEDVKAYYYEKREQFNQMLTSNLSDAHAAALFIFINKHCFNGLYRVNAKGLFNVPYNGSTRASYSDQNIFAVSEALSNATILEGDFEEACMTAKEGDFVFFDSPYAPLNPTSFEAYTKEGFSREDHIRLAQTFRRLDKRGCYCMLTNHNTDFINELYQDYTIEVVNVKRSINSDASKRTGTEVIIRNY